MKTSWGLEMGHLACRWFEGGTRVPYDWTWLRDVAGSQGSYLPPLPDFPSHTPFGIPSWFERYVERS